MDQASQVWSIILPTPVTIPFYPPLPHFAHLLPHSTLSGFTCSGRSQSASMDRKALAFSLTVVPADHIVCFMQQPVNHTFQWCKNPLVLGHVCFFTAIDLIFQPFNNLFCFYCLPTFVFSSLGSRFPCLSDCPYSTTGWFYSQLWELSVNLEGRLSQSGLLLCGFSRCASFG